MLYLQFHGVSLEMPVKYFHKRYIAIYSSEELDSSEIYDTFKLLYGIIRYSISGFKLKVRVSKNISIWQIGSKYVLNGIAAIVYYALSKGIYVDLIGIHPTVKASKNAIRTYNVTM